MGGYKRKIRRKQAQKRAKDAQKDIQQKLGLFDKLEDSCLACSEPFDKTSKEQVQSWRVIIKEEKVRLYCPECWDNATKIIEEVKNDFRVQSAARSQSSDESKS